MSKVLTDLRDLVRYSIPELYDFLCHHDLVTMLFCYRWLLLSFRREFSMTDVSALSVCVCVCVYVCVCV